MPRKTKEANEEKAAINQNTLNNATKTLIESEGKASKSKKTVAKKANTKKVSTSKKASSTDKKTTTKSKPTKATTKKATKEKKVPAEKKTVKKVAKTTSKTSKKNTTKKTATKSTVTTTTKKATKTASKTKATKVSKPSIVEYYDLPYKYNQTVVKILYQNPTTLFVYWEISDDDIEKYKEMYGENFFDTTRPALIVYNDTMNYSFEIDINDFANSWYFNINDSKCDYRVELIRRPVFYNEKIKTDYIYITSSNKINTPNDKILFSTNEPSTIYFRNTKNNNLRKVNLPRLLEQLNLTNKNVGFPIVRNVNELYKNIYKIEDAEEFSISLTNPSSRGGNPSSHSLSSRFTY